MGKFLNKASLWIEKRQRQELLKKFGGIQTCPYCLQVAQKGYNWSFVLYDRDPFLDVLTCGVCKGKSLWKFELGMFYVGPHTAPNAKHEPMKGYDFKNACLDMSFFEVKESES